MTGTNQKYEQSNKESAHGTEFERDTTLLKYLRCVKLHNDFVKNPNSGVKSFLVANNVKGAGAFDDVVVKVEHVHENEVKTKAMFIQCKHVDGQGEKKYKNMLRKNEIKKYFKDFVIIKHTLRDHNELNNTGNDTESQEQNETEFDLQNFLNCLFSDCEFFFFSNVNYIESTETDYIKEYTTAEASEITAEILSHTKKEGKEYRLVTEKCKEFLECPPEFSDQKDELISEFCLKFRYFLNQADKLYVHIVSAMKNCTDNQLEGIDIDFLHKTVVEETKLSFEPTKASAAKKNFCYPLTEETNMLQNLTRLLDLKKTSTEILEKYAQQICQCTKKIIEQMSKPSIKIVKTQYIKIMKIKIYRALTALKQENLCFLLNNKDDLEKFKRASETCKYKKEKKIYIFLENSVYFPKKKLDNEYILKIEQDETKTQDDQELINETLSEIKSISVSLQGCDVTVGEILNNGMDVLDEGDICDFLEQKVSYIGSKLASKSSLYIDRIFNVRVYNQNTLDKIKQHISSEGNKTYIIFSEKEKNIFSGTWIKCVKTIADARKTINELAESEKQKDTIHICMHKNEEIKFMYSIGEQSDRIETKVETEGYLVDNGDNSVNIGRVTILTGVAGMGKTTSMVSLGSKCKENHQLHLVYFIELSKHINILHQTKKIENATEFVAKDILELKGLEYKLFVNACNKTGQIALFFDAFDEISPKAEKELTQLLLALEKTKIAKIFVSSRPKSVSVLETALLQQSLNFVNFSTEEKENCLMKFWTQKLEDNKELTDTSLLIPTVMKIIELLESKEKLLNKLIAIPLQIIMVAKVYYKTMLAILKKKTYVDDVTLDLINLYENYIICHVEHFYIDKLKVNWDEIEKAKRERYIREKLRDSSTLAYRHIVLTENEFIGDLHDAFLALHDDLGIIVNENPPIFSHRTIAEYLAAKHIVSHLFSRECNYATANDINKILIYDKCEVVRTFINSLIDVKKLPPYFNNIDKNEKLVTYADGLNNPIHVAATEGNIKLLEALLNRDKSLIDLIDKDGRTALLCACKSDREDIVHFLINQNCSIDTVDNRGNNVLHYASENGNAEILELILHAPSNAAAADLETDKNVRTLTLSDNLKLLLNMKSRNNFTPLYCAVKSGKLNAVKFLIDQPDCKLYIFTNNIVLYDIWDDGGVLHFAAYKNDIAIMEVLLKRDMTLLNMLNNFNKTALHYACSKGNVEAAKLLLDHKCKTDIINKEGRTVLHAVCESQTNSNEIIKLLLKQDPKLLNIKDRYGVTALQHACECGNVSAVRTLLDDTDCKLDILDNDEGNTVLHAAAQSGCIEIIDLFLQRDKSLLCKKNKREKTPLQVACQYNKADAVQYFLNHTETINQNQEIKTTFRTAVEGGLNNVIEHLANRYPFVIHEKYDRGGTALHVACSGTSRNIRTLHDTINFLIKNGCQVNERDDNGDTPFHIIANNKYRNKSYQIQGMETLLKHDSSLLDLQNKNKQTALHLACALAMIEIIRFLLDKNCSIHLKDENDKTALQCVPKGYRYYNDIMSLFMIKRGHCCRSWNWESL